MGEFGGALLVVLGLWWGRVSEGLVEHFWWCGCLWRGCVGGVGEALFGGVGGVQLWVVLVEHFSWC